MILARRASSCSRHRAVLVAFVDRRERTPATFDALDHLDRCRACTEELSGIALAIAGLRRIHHQVDAVEPPIDAWPRLVARITRPHPAPWRWPATLAGMVASTLLVAVLVAPTALDTTRQTEVLTSVAPVPVRMSDAERSYLAAARRVRPAADVAESTGGSVPRIYPDGIRPEQKEVKATNATGRPIPVI